MTTVARPVQYVSGRVGQHSFAVPLAHVRNVFIPEKLTPVPLAPPEVAGLLNFRGRVITALDLRIRLGLPPSRDARMAIGIDHNDNDYGLLVDDVGDVVTVEETSSLATASAVDPKVAEMSAGVLSFENCTLVLLDIERVLEWKQGLA